MKDKKVIVIGAGAGGMIAAGTAAQKRAEVLILEKTNQPGQKILISGKMRCNLTNSKELEEFIPAYGSNGKFLYGAFSRFFREDLLELMNKYGVKTKTERGGRIFPESDDANDVVKALQKFMAEYGVKLKTNTRVTDILTSDGRVTGVRTSSGEIAAGTVILAVGGSSYPATGSTGDGYKIAESLGHTIVKLRPALVPLVVEEIELAKSMQGVSLKNVTLTAYRARSEDLDHITGNKLVIDTHLGEMMMTHFGIGGPITLLMSLKIVDALEKGPVCASVDLKPGLDLKQLQLRIQRDLDSFSKRSISNIMKELVPLKLIDPILKLSGIPPEKLGSQISSADRNHLASILKSIRFNIKSPLPMGTAMVTAGGISLKEIDPRTMQSKLIQGLYFCGEVIDINADTGGYNLQAAFSTGFVAGESAAEYVLKS
jgi:predicted Rossmann fold flavoprotein